MTHSPQNTFNSPSAQRTANPESCCLFGLQKFDVHRAMPHRGGGPHRPGIVGSEDDLRQVEAVISLNFDPVAQVKSFGDSINALRKSSTSGLGTSTGAETPNLVRTSDSDMPSFGDGLKVDGAASYCGPTIRPSLCCDFLRCGGFIGRPCA
jgi:hypothetical protein